MDDEITINLKGLDEKGRKEIAVVLDRQQELIEDETNYEALQKITEFKED